jgi:hypothetical protein
MGYTTDFEGFVTITPPLNASEIAYLNDFAETRRMHRAAGPYFVRGTGAFGQGNDGDVLDFNSPDPSQPGLWCQWRPLSDGSGLEWDGGEKFYNAPEWMRYLVALISTKPDDETYALMLAADERFADFTFDHVVEGEIQAQGEDTGDRWLLVVTDNVVAVQKATFTYE